MSKIEELAQWAKDEEREHGLKDVKFFPGRDREVSLEKAAADALVLLKGNPYEDDITNETS